ncbi:MAG: hypothetical protein D6685_14125 [Bacteroidetes bacterium]|nr:MAG: hypothetical protein D6685_14125 [Bacteroidota bacterium]
MKIASRVSLFAILLPLSVLAGCGSRSTATQDSPPRVDTYTVRGLVVALPDPDKPGSELWVRHEAIPDYRDHEGKVIGMAEMKMPFPLAKGLSLDGIKPGDKIEMTFEVTWEPRANLRVTAIRKLPPDAELRLSGSSS